VSLLKHFSVVAFAAMVCAWALPPTALADPPSHAPAHGWREKHDPYYVGYTGRHWSDDYGIRNGHCDRDRVGAALGAAVGGTIGAAASDGSDRLIAILAGATIGAIIGHEIGDHMDDRDRACFGHSLELLEDGRRVGWQGSTSETTYVLTPDRRFGRDGHVCRHFTLVREQGGRRIVKEGNACRFDQGDWRMIEA
jgi:surface antigen